MYRSRSRLTQLGRALLIGAGAAAIGGGCGVDPCNSAINANGGRYDVYVTGVSGAYPPPSIDSCAGLDGIAPGATLSLETVGAFDDGSQFCRYAVADLLTGPAALTPAPPSSAPLADLSGLGKSPFMESFAKVTTPGCSGTVELVFVDYGLMYRIFLPSSGSCPVCDDDFSVEITRLQ